MTTTGAAKGRKKQSRKEALDEMTAIIMDHLSQFSPEERARRIRKFGDNIDKISAARAKSLKGARTAAKSR